MREILSQRGKIQVKERTIQLFSNFIEYMKTKYKIYSIILFGSRSHGNALFYSDYDLLIIEDFAQPYLMRTKKAVEFLPRTVAVDLFCYNVREFEEFLNNKKIHILDAVKNGIVLYDQNFIQKYR